MTSDSTGRARGWARDAAGLVDGAAEALGLAAQVQKRPYAMVGAALGVGYVLGGGLFTPTTARLVRFGFKLAEVPLVQATLLQVAEAALDGVLARTAGTHSK